jgi:hypothetical protein
VRRKLITGLVLTAAVAVVPSAAFAGEVTGNGKDTQGPAHARSICVFSGKNDSPTDPFPEGGVSQSYGQLVSKGLKGELPSPGVACNPTKGAPEEG